MSDPPVPTGDERPDPERNPESLVGATLAGRYRIVRFLGAGAMGSVYVGEHLKIGRRDAIKVLRTSLARDPEAVARFTRGARNASAIRHPNVCTVYDFSDTAEGLQFLAMELVDGESLNDLMSREGPLPVERAVRIAVQAAAALEAAHELQIVHRDFKPDNVMIARERDGGDVVKVVDFDIAKGSKEAEGSGVTRLGFVVGTPEYMSPEQLTGDALDGRSDVYSLALVLFRMLTGDLPFRSSSTQELMVDRLTKDPMRLGEVAPDMTFPGPLQAALDRALSRDRVGRPASARAFAEEIWTAAFGAGAPVTSAGARESRPLPATVVAPAGGVGTDGEGDDRWAAVPGGRPAVIAAAVTGVGLAAVLATFALGGGPGPAEVVLPASMPLSVGESAYLDASIRDDDGSEVPGAEVRWESDRPDVASIAPDGMVRALSPGVAVVRAWVGDVDGSTRVTVSAAGSPDAPALAREALSIRVSEGRSPPPPERVAVEPSGTPAADLVASVTYDDPTAPPWLDARVEEGSSGAELVVGAAGDVPSAGRHRADVVVRRPGSAEGATLAVTLDVVAQPREERIAVAVANARAWDQLIHLTDNPSNATRRAVKDTASALWSATYLPDSVRAMAAYVHAQASVELNELEDGLAWARRAASLQPGNQLFDQFLRDLRSRIR